jgi:hypothetical protein
VISRPALPGFSSARTTEASPLRWRAVRRQDDKSDRWDAGSGRLESGRSEKSGQHRRLLPSRECTSERSAPAGLEAEGGTSTRERRRRRPIDRESDGPRARDERGSRRRQGPRRGTWNQATQDQQSEAAGGIGSIPSRVPPPSLQHHPGGKAGSLRRRSPLGVDEPCQRLILDQHPDCRPRRIAYRHTDMLLKPPRWPRVVRHS